MNGNSSDKARKIAKESLDKLANDLEAGKSEALKQYLATMSRFHRYSWNNVLLISSQNPQATHVAGFHAWHDLGRSVRKGEKGIMILAPMVVKGDQQDPDKELKARGRLVGFRTAYVFDIAQTDGRPLPAFAQTTGDPKEYTDELKRIATARGVAIEYDASIAPALGMSSGGRIRLMPDLPKAEEFAVLAHELAHEAMHHDKSVERLPKVVRETQAEAVAFVVSHAVGLETNHAAADYIALYNGDKKTLIESLAKIQETSAKILEELLPEHTRADGQSHTPSSPSSPSATPLQDLASVSSDLPAHPDPLPEQISLDR